MDLERSNTRSSVGKEVSYTEKHGESTKYCEERKKEEERENGIGSALRKCMDFWLL